MKIKEGEAREIGGKLYVLRKSEGADDCGLCAAKEFCRQRGSLLCPELEVPYGFNFQRKGKAVDIIELTEGNSGKLLEIFAKYPKEHLLSLGQSGFFRLVVREFGKQ